MAKSKTESNVVDRPINLSGCLHELHNVLYMNGLDLSKPVTLAYVGNAPKHTGWHVKGTRKIKKS